MLTNCMIISDKISHFVLNKVRIMFMLGVASNSYFNILATESSSQQLQYTICKVIGLKYKTWLHDPIFVLTFYKINWENINFGLPFPTSHLLFTELGRNQAEITGERIKDLLGDKITHCYISTYPRAMETGHIILKHLDKGYLSYFRTPDYLLESITVVSVSATLYW